MVPKPKMRFTKSLKNSDPRGNRTLVTDLLSHAKKCKEIVPDWLNSDGREKTPTLLLINEKFSFTRTIHCPKTGATFK